jgi:hypothetical protein
MRAKEFLSETDGSRTVTINIPINITIPSGGGDPVVNTAPAGGELPPEPVNVFPLQQELELLKHKSGKTSKVINQIVDENGAWSKANERIEYNIQEDYEDLYAEYNKHLQESHQEESQ